MSTDGTYPHERMRAALAAAQDGAMTIEQLKDRIDTRLNNCLCEMKEGYDDSIVGFNEAWDIVRAVFAEALRPPARAPAESEVMQHRQSKPPNGPGNLSGPDKTPPLSASEPAGAPSVLLTGVHPHGKPLRDK